MKFIQLFSVFISASITLGSANPAPAVIAPVAAQPAVAAVPATPAAPANPATPATPGQMTPEQVLMTCSMPHVFTQEEIKSMNQVFGIAIILLQYQLFVNQDKTNEQETYNQLLKLWRTLIDMFKEIK